MQRIRESLLVVSLLAVIAIGAAGNVSLGATERAHRAGKVDDGIIASILDFFGIAPQSKVSIPPG
jgi:hypothetical protein